MHLKPFYHFQCLTSGHSMENRLALVRLTALLIKNTSFHTYFTFAVTVKKKRHTLA